MGPFYLKKAQKSGLCGWGNKVKLGRNGLID